MATEPSGSTATPSGCCSRASAAAPSRWPKSKRPWPTAVATSVGRTSRSAEVSASATQSAPSPTASPDGWAKNASAGGPSRSPSSVVPAHAAVVPVAGSQVQSWWLPAIATTTCPSHQATSHGVDSSAAVAPGATRSRSCAPVPATVLTAPSASRTRRRAWLTLSATSTSPSGSRSRPSGSLNRAIVPSTSPRSPVPIRRRSVTRSGASSTSWWWAVSETRKVPPGSAMTLPGKRSAVVGSGGATYGPSPRRNASACSTTSSSMSTASPCAWPSPDICATT